MMKDNTNTKKKMKFQNLATLKTAKKILTEISEIIEDEPPADIDMKTISELAIGSIGLTIGSMAGVYALYLDGSLYRLDSTKDGLINSGLIISGSVLLGLLLVAIPAIIFGTFSFIMGSYLKAEKLRAIKLSCYQEAIQKYTKLVTLENREEDTIKKEYFQALMLILEALMDDLAFDLNWLADDEPVAEVQSDSLNKVDRLNRTELVND